MEPHVVVCQKITTTKDDDFCTRIKKDEITETGTAGMKYVSSTEEQDSDSDFEEQATDNLLGRLRKGMNLIKNYARETMAQCDTDESRSDMADRLEKSHLGMLRAEKSFLSTTKIIAEIVDEFASDYEDDKDTAESKADDGQECSETKSIIPIIFRPTAANGLSIRNYGSRLSKVMKERMTDYEDGLTDDVLRSEKKFRDLQKQIKVGKQDSEKNPKLEELDVYNSDRGAGDGDLEEPVELCPMTNLRLEESDDEEDSDETVLPSTDPITLQPIITAVRNKFCNHIFDQASISDFMMTNPQATCPMYGCRNEKPLSQDHFLKQARLTEKIRQKNAKLH